MSNNIKVCRFLQQGFVFLILYLQYLFFILKPKKMISKYWIFSKDYTQFINESQKSVPVQFYPIVTEKNQTTGFDPHYVYHSYWAMNKLKQINPLIHVDISSSIRFIAMASSFFSIVHLDISPPKLLLHNISIIKSDIVKIPFISNSISSLSCMHVVEHIGLGRYGDKIDSEGDIKAFTEMKRVIKTGGHILVVVPIGQSKIMFNAHRIYSYNQIITYFSDFELIEFSLIPDNGYNSGLITNASKKSADECSYGCGCFWFQKK